jgi:hypothetical protein
MQHTATRPDASANHAPGERRDSESRSTSQTSAPTISVELSVNGKTYALTLDPRTSPARRKAAITASAARAPCT